MVSNDKKIKTREKSKLRAWKDKAKNWSGISKTYFRFH